MKVESFELDHTKVGAPYVRLAKTWDINGQIINKFDLRFLQPNQDEMTFQELHTIEHLLATYLRDKLDNIIDIAPYGCHVKGTKVIMHDGSLKNVEDVQVGDKLMGDDSTPREVLKLLGGVDTLYRVSQSRAESYVVNGSHLLHLKQSKNRVYKGYGKGDTINITVEDFLNQSTAFKSVFKGYKVGYEGSYKNLPLPPYILGLWLGDGVRCKPCLCVSDYEPEIANSWVEYGESLGCYPYIEQDKGASKRYWLFYKKNNPNPFMEIIRNNNLYKNKHIPEIYYGSSRNQRLMLLAGLINSDGWCSKREFGKRANVSFGNSSYNLIQQVKRLANSLGFYTNVIEAKGEHISSINGREFICQPYYHLNICGDLNELSPLLIKHKRPSMRSSNRNPSLSSISIEKLSEGEFYGFILDSNQLYLLEDGTVSHNCSTGYGLIGYGFTIEELKEALEETLLDILNMTEVPADNPVQCGNYKTLDMQAAKVFVQSLLPLNFKIQETITYKKEDYPQYFR